MDHRYLPRTFLTSLLELNHSKEGPVKTRVKQVLGLYYVHILKLEVVFQRKNCSSNFLKWKMIYTDGSSSWYLFGVSSSSEVLWILVSNRKTAIERKPDDAKDASSPARMIRNFIKQLLRGHPAERNSQELALPRMCWANSVDLKRKMHHVTMYVSMSFTCHMSSLSILSKAFPQTQAEYDFLSPKQLHDHLKNCQTSLNQINQNPLNIHHRRPPSFSSNTNSGASAKLPCKMATQLPELPAKGKQLAVTF